jgi:uncharacterized protein
MQGDIKEFLSQSNWAVIGVSSDSEKFGTKVYFKLKKLGYNVFAVNPKLDQIDGNPVYPSLSALPLVPDTISVVVPPKVTEQIMDECAQLGIQRVWMQPGSENAEAIRKGNDHGLKLIHNQCVLVQTPEI